MIEVSRVDKMKIQRKLLTKEQKNDVEAKIEELKNLQATFEQ